MVTFTEYYTNNMISSQEHTLGANIFASGLTPPDPINTPTDADGLSSVAIIMIVLAIVLIIVIAVVGYICYAKKKK